MPKFIPEDQIDSKMIDNIPFFQEAKSLDGWRGIGTTKSIKTLMAEISAEIARMGGTVSSIVKGRFDTDPERWGYRIEFDLVKGERIFPGKIELAALPVKKPKHMNQKTKKGYNTRLDKSLRMALYMIREYIAAGRLIGLMDLDHIPLVPWLIPSGSEFTISQIFNTGSQPQLSEPKEGDIHEGTFRELED